jgi:hypothetical protein
LKIKNDLCLIVHIRIDKDTILPMDPITPVNRKMMDYLFENKEVVPEQIYKTMTNMLMTKEDEDQKTTNKYFKIKYNLVTMFNSVISVSDENGNIVGPCLNQNRTTCNKEHILKGILFEDIPDYYSQLDNINSGFIEINNEGTLVFPYMSKPGSQLWGDNWKTDVEVCNVLLTVISLEEVTL